MNNDEPALPPDASPLPYSHGRRPLGFSGSAGREARAYLRFILDHYDALPDRTLFLHDHQSSWHISDIVPIVRALNWSLPFANVNDITAMTEISPSIWPTRYQHVVDHWAALFADELGPIPPFLRFHCCAQFLVARERIRLRSRAFYQRLYDYNLVHPDMSDPDAAIMQVRGSDRRDRATTSVRFRAPLVSPTGAHVGSHLRAAA